MKFWKPKYQVIEVNKVGRPSNEVSRDDWRALGAHPIFQELVGRLKAQNEILRSRLAATRFADLNDLAYVQSGIFWTGWISQEIARLTAEPPKPELPPFDAEEAEFNKINELLERVGVPDSQN